MPPQEGELLFGVVPDLKDPQEVSEYQRLLQSTYDAVLITDRSGLVVDFNWRVEEAFLFESGSFPWTNVLEFISGADPKLMGNLAGVLEDHPYVLIEAHCNRLGGSLFPAEIAVSRVGLTSGREYGFFFRDITIRKQALEALEAAVVRLEEHDRARSAFVDNVSHELRTPLTSMLYAVSNMLKGVVGPIPDRARSYLEMLDGDCRRLWATVNDILDMRKIEDETLVLSKTCVPLVPLLQRCADSVQVQAQAKTQKLDLSFSGPGWFVECDTQKLERVFYNLIANSIKYTPEGGNISVEVSESGVGGGLVGVTVTDDGVGIPSESIDKVMDRYFRVGEQVSGTGLGLPISKEIIEMHGGSISLASPPPGKDCGTAATVTLASESAPLVYLFGERSENVDKLAKPLRAHGYDVSAFTEKLEVKRACHDRQPRLIVVDLSGSETEWSLILEVKSDRESMEIPVIAATAKNNSGKEHELLTPFVSAFIVRPIVEVELMEAVNIALLGKTGFRA